MGALSEIFDGPILTKCLGFFPEETNSNYFPSSGPSGEASQNRTCLCVSTCMPVPLPTAKSPELENEFIKRKFLQQLFHRFRLSIDFENKPQPQPQPQARQTAPLGPRFPDFPVAAREGSSNSPLINVGNYPGTTNYHVAPSSGTPSCKPDKKPYSFEEELGLMIAVAKHGRNWKKIAEIFKDTQRTDDNFKQKWKHMMEKALMMATAGTKMDDWRQNELHIFAAVVQFNDKKKSIHQEEFKKWFAKMGNLDREIKAWADKWLDEFKKEANLPRDNLHRSKKMKRMA